MSTLRSVGIGLLASLLVGAVVPSAALAKKPGSDPPPPKPVTYNLVWLEGPGYTTRALGVNDSGTVVGYASTHGRADPHAFICTDLDSGTIQDLNEESCVGDDLDDPQA